ncbi:glycosyltransferase family 2 protein [Thermodesulfovibrionales bacterium]|nr:glycosyltransferase family 2 protein [Thermodesulfovibrionales bacterium]
MAKNNPKISILIPCYNEEKHIKDCLDSIIDDYVIDNAEILIADGMSTDDTRKIVEDYIKKYPDIIIKLINNEKRHQSYSLNMGIDRAQGNVIVRIDAHARYPKGYVRACVELLERTGADNVGGATYAQGKTRFQKLVARAMRHPIGVGNAKFRLGNYKGFVDTVFPGTFRKSLFKKLGYFDPYTSEDAEFNLRILKSGGKIYLDSSIKIEYFPRDTLKGLVRQYFNYGKGRCRTTLKHRQFTSWRQLAPIALVLVLVGSLILSFLNPLFLLPPLAYLSLMFFASWTALRGENSGVGDIFLLAIIFMSMHVSYGCGFLMRFLKLAK